MTASPRCKVCDRAECRRVDAMPDHVRDIAERVLYLRRDEGPGWTSAELATVQDWLRAQRDAAEECAVRAVDWRARCLAAETALGVEGERR